MALGETQYLDVQETNAERVASVSLTSKWTDAIDNPETLDNASPTNPTTQITDSTRHIVTDEGRQGTHVVPRYKWEAARTHSTSPVFAFFGRTGDDAWVRLRTKAGTLTWTPTLTNYTTDGTYNYTVPDLSSDPVDRMGCKEILCCTTVAAVFTVTEGNAGALQLKPI